MEHRSAAKFPQVRIFAQRGASRGTFLRVLAAIVLAAGAYGLAGFYGGPWLVDRWLAQQRDSAPGRTAARARVQFDPFSLVAEVEELEITDSQIGAAFSARRLTVDFSIRTVLERRPVVTSIDIDTPRIALESLDSFTSAVRGLRSSLIGDAAIERLAVTAGTLATDADGDGAFGLSGLAVSMTSFDARAGSPGTVRLQAVTTDGGTVAIDASLAADLEAAQGRLRLTDIDFANIAARLDGTIAAVEPRGRVDIASEFSARSGSDTPTLELTDTNLMFRELSLQPAAELDVTAESLSAAATLGITADSSGVELTGRIEANGQRVTFTDSRVSPRQDFELDDVALLATVDGGDDGLSLVLGGRIREAGAANLTVRIPGGGAASRVSIEADDLPAAKLSAYAFDLFGRSLASGSANIDLEYALNGRRIDGSVQLAARDIVFAAASADESPGIEDSSLELAAALLENSAGVIELNLRFAGAAGSVRGALADALSARIAAVTATPFDTLAALVDGAGGASNAIAFLPGDAALNDRALAAVSALADVLSARPRLGVRIFGASDEQIDREALARQQIELHVQLATAGPAVRARPAPVDFSSPRARDVLDEFAGERLPAERVAELAARFDCEAALAAVCERAYYEQIFDALVANEAIGSAPLGRLGRFRAQSIADALRERGIAPERIEIATAAGTADTPFGIGVPVELTVPASAP